MELSRSDDIYPYVSRRYFHTGKSFHSTNDFTNTSSVFPSDSHVAQMNALLFWFSVSVTLGNQTHNTVPSKSK